jgi:hypothetical protein
MLQDCGPNKKGPKEEMESEIPSPETMDMCT